MIGEDMTGVCTRFAVLRRSNDEPIEGMLYSDRSKANWRLGGTANPGDFYVGEVAVMPLAVAHRLVAALSD